jgi:hypothetical protein
MPSVFDRLFPVGIDYLDPEGAFFLMALDALVYLDSELYADQLAAIFGAEAVTQIPSPAPYVPALLTLRAGDRVIVAAEGTRGPWAWFNYVATAGGKRWQGFDGLVFGPFADIAEAAFPGVMDSIYASDRIRFSGHSLGAPVVSLIGNSLRWTGYAVEPLVLFAVPNFADAAFLANVVLSAYTVDLPGDPVPYLPPNVVFLMKNKPYELRWNQVYGRIAGGFQPLSPFQAADALNRFDWWILIAAAGSDLQVNMHQTYMYLWACWNGIQDPPTAEASALFLLLKGLGLLAPWPMAEASERPLATIGLGAELVDDVEAEQTTSQVPRYLSL